ncbi:MAG: arginine repressor [Actinomycetota bacterium]
MKAQRQRRIIRILAERAVTSQHELAELLAAAGHHATQATVSRDLEELGAVKVRRNGSIVYALPGEGAVALAGEALARLLTASITALERSGNLVVIRTPPGHANMVAGVLDRASIEGVAGTLAGDDTILVVCEEEIPTGQVECRLRSLVGM